MSADETTMELMFEECRHGQALICEWSDAVDAKVLALFGSASVLIGAIPAIGGVTARGWDWTPWIIAGVAWAIASVLCSLAYGTRSYLLGPDPSVLLGDDWVKLAPHEYRENRIYWMGKAWKQNQEAINKKGSLLGWAIPFVAIESAALLAALLIQG